VTGLVLRGTGRSDAVKHRKPMRDYLKGEPRQKVRYCDRLAALIIEVTE